MSKERIGAFWGIGTPQWGIGTPQASVLSTQTRKGPDYRTSHNLIAYPSTWGNLRSSWTRISGITSHVDELGRGRVVGTAPAMTSKMGEAQSLSLWAFFVPRRNQVSWGNSLITEVLLLSGIMLKGMKVMSTDGKASRIHPYPPLVS